MTEAEEKTLRDYVDYVSHRDSVFTLCITDVAKAILSAFKTIKDQKEWMARFENDSEAYKQGKRDERQAIIEIVADMHDHEKDGMYDETRSAPERRAHSHAFHVIHQLFRKLVERRKE